MAQKKRISITIDIITDNDHDAPLLADAVRDTVGDWLMLPAKIEKVRHREDYLPGDYA